MTGHDSLPEAPSIVLVSASTIDLSDPIFDDLKVDYPEFGDWWKTTVVARYQTHLPKKLTLEMLTDHGILKGAPQSVTRLTDVQFESIKVDGKIDRGLVIN